MLGIIIVALSVLSAAYLIAKKYYAPGALLLVGLITLGVAAVVGPEPILTGKKVTHLEGLDVIQTFTNLLQTRTAGLGMNIMAIAGFSSYMSAIGASKALVQISVKPLTLIHSPYLVMSLGLILSLILNIFIPSAAGLALLLMVSLYPVMIAAGVSRQSAAATILIGGSCCFGPSGGNNLLAAELTKMHVMDFFLNVQVMVGWAAVVVMLVVNYFVQKTLDQKDLASGRITQADFQLPDAAPDEKKDGKEERKVPAFYALFPLIPVVLLFVFSPLMYKGIRMEVVTALLTATFTAFVIDGLIRRNLRESIANMKSYAQGMGKVFTSTVFLIVCAEVFAAGLTKSGGIATIIQAAAGMDAGAAAVFTVMFLIVVGCAFVMGSGNAPFFSFAPMIPDAAAAVGANAAFMMSPLQLISGMGRSSSPVAGVTIAVSGLSGVDPFVLIRRSIPVMVCSIIAVYVSALLQI
ncbi:C4-dicarboxylate transporter DcuC [Sutterella sp.]|uniref:C4-dicarboxylate transporter DcuC n=1 Tax=Sutterella sp. TaxID=1981025 RepID=UPI0026E0E7A4|nr:C4-dicarboxylate transporter DcuC [Sutterella sp.]MDO5532195.1 C4-dicarboxylate transporter DcuC [Sutterella sp.]